MTTPCYWREDENGVWETACGNLYVINEGTPAENDMRFCCYCGKSLIQSTPITEEDNDHR